MPAWVHRHDRKRQRGRVGDESRDKENQALALECLCKMVSLLDGDFARQVVSAGGLQCLVGAMICGDEAQARQAQSALLCIREKQARLSETLRTRPLPPSVAKPSRTEASGPRATTHLAQSVRRRTRPER